MKILINHVVKKLFPLFALTLIGMVSLSIYAEDTDKKSAKQKNSANNSIETPNQGSAWPGPL